MADTMPPEPTGWGARREWQLRSIATADNPNGITTQGAFMSEAEARERAAALNAEKRPGWTFRAVYRDTTPWTLAPESDDEQPLTRLDEGE